MTIVAQVSIMAPGPLVLYVNLGVFFVAAKLRFDFIFTLRVEQYLQNMLRLSLYGRNKVGCMKL